MKAQDINPVFLGVLKKARCPVVYIGDPYQQIYEWRGAVNAMEQIPSKDRVLLSHSSGSVPRSLRQQRRCCGSSGRLRPFVAMGHSGLSWRGYGLMQSCPAAIPVS